MTIVKDIVPKDLVFGELATFKGMGIIPLCIDQCPEIPALETLEEALSHGTIEITETSETGEVPHLLAKNRGERHVLLLDGEHITGGKQSRVLNSTVIVLSKTTVRIPVSCVESGRWSYSQKNFKSSETILRSKSRAVMQEGITSNVRHSGTFQSDQSAVWRTVDDTLRECGVRSETSAFDTAREHVSPGIEQYVAAFHPTERQIGGIYFGASGIPLGVEFLADTRLYAASHDKILRSFAFDVVSAPNVNGAPVDGATAFWRRLVECEFSSHRSVGTGDDIRVDQNGFIAAGLIWSGVMIHFSGFPNHSANHANEGQGRRSSSKQRRRNLRSTIA
ncbi:MAG: DUF6569 family protein [Syntrophobacteraceae bacterium]